VALEPLFLVLSMVMSFRGAASPAQGGRGVIEAAQGTGSWWRGRPPMCREGSAAQGESRHEMGLRGIEGNGFFH
jgi:hypothetical protein